MLKVLLIVVIVAVLAVLAVATTKPDTLSVQRSIRINASPESVFEWINDLHRWEEWSPWARRDPNMTATYSGAASGLGAIYEWRGNNEVGQGRMEITNSSPASHVALNLEFMKSFASTAQVEFALATDGDYTDLTWSMLSPNSFVAKVFSVFWDMEAMIGKEYKTGLATLKTLVER